MAGLCFLFFLLLFYFFPSPPIRSGEVFSSVIFFPLFLFFCLCFLDVAMVWKGKPASVTTGSRDRTYVRKNNNNNVTTLGNPFNIMKSFCPYSQCSLLNILTCFEGLDAFRFFSKLKTNTPHLLNVMTKVEWKSGEVATIDRLGFCV